MILSIKKQLLSALIVVFLILSCGDSGGSDPNPDPQSNLPGKVQARLPVNGEQCTEFEEVQGEPSKVLIFLEWTSAQLADNYEIRIFEGNNQVFTETTSSLESNAILDEGKSYSWYVIAKNGEGETQSDTFSFTTPGEPVGNFAPYAAQITVEFDLSTSEMNISWIGGDEDGDALTYDVKVWEEGELLLESNDLTETSIAPVSIVSIFDYVVEVVSTDNLGNFSISRVNVRL